MIDFIEISIKSTGMIPTIHIKIEPIKARFSTNDRLGFTVTTYAVGEMVIIYYRQVLLPIGIAWLCERWYRGGTTTDPWCK